MRTWGASSRVRERWNASCGSCSSKPIRTCSTSLWSAVFFTRIHPINAKFPVQSGNYHNLSRVGFHAVNETSWKETWRLPEVNKRCVLTPSMKRRCSIYGHLAEDIRVVCNSLPRFSLAACCLAACCCCRASSASCQLFLRMSFKFLNPFLACVHSSIF